MNNPTYEFNGYTIKGPAKSQIYKTVEGDQTIVIIRDGTIYATIQFVNNGLNIYASNGTRTEGNVIYFL